MTVFRVNRLFFVGVTGVAIAISSFLCLQPRIHEDAESGKVVCVCVCERESRRVSVCMSVCVCEGAGVRV